MIIKELSTIFTKTASILFKPKNAKQSLPGAC